MDEKVRHLMFSSLDPEWGTPKDLYQELDRQYNFTVDLCATEKNKKHENYISPEQDFFKTTATGVGFMNPPYNKPERPCSKNCKKKSCEKRGFHTKLYIPGQIDFVIRAVQLASMGLLTTVALLPARTDTKIFHRYIWDWREGGVRENVELNFIEGRLKFENEHGLDNAAPFPSMLVVFNKKK